MPEYHLPVSGPVGSKGFFELDAFTRGYIEALFFTNCSDPDDGELEGMEFSDLAPEALERIIKDCEAFQRDTQALLDQAYERSGYDEDRAGNDFWYTRNGHGVGYWDRRPLEAGGLGDRLSALCGWKGSYREVDVYLGDDGKVHLS